MSGLAEETAEPVRGPSGPPERGDPAPTGPPEPEVHAPWHRRLRGRTGLVVFSLLWVLFGTWAIATPIFAAPDEPTHSIRAVSVARGQIIGRKTSDAVTVVRAPALYGEAAARISCFAFRPDVTPTCAGAFEGSHRLVPTPTYVGRYNPLYYGAVGLPSLLATDNIGIYLMRLASAALAAGLVTLAVLAALRSPRPSLTILGVAFGLTPMTLFLAGSVNPNGMEIAAAICLWTTGFLILDPARRRTPLIVWAAVGACLLVLSRGLSPLWLLLILAIQAGAALREPRRTLMGDRRMVIAGLAVGATTLVALVWIALTDALAVLPVGVKVPGSLNDAAVEILSQSEVFFEQMVGVLQWVDVRAPWVTYRFWMVGLGLLVLLALAVAPLRVKLALLACIALTFLSPLIQLPSVETTGLIWQGRYSLPLAVGVPIIAAYGLWTAGDEVAMLLRRLSTVLVVLMGLALVGTFLWAGRRNAVGTDGPLLYFGREEWRSPLPGWFLMATFTVTVGSLVALFMLLVRRESAAALRTTT